MISLDPDGTIFVGATPVTLAPADLFDPRIDLVGLGELGAWDVRAITGTPSPCPASPCPPPGFLELLQVRRLACAGQVGIQDLTPYSASVMS